MLVKDLIEKMPSIKIINEGDFEREITGVYCCDLLSIVMGQAPADCAWVTVMGNINGIAVATLADMAVIVVAENAAIDDVTISKAKQQGINLIKVKDPIFPTAKAIDALVQVD